MTGGKVSYLELRRDLKKSLLPQHYRQSGLLKTSSDLGTFLLTTLHPIGIKPSPYLGLYGLHDLVLAASPSFSTPPSLSALMAQGLLLFLVPGSLAPA